MGSRRWRFLTRRRLLPGLGELYILNFHTAKADLALQVDGCLGVGVRLSGDINAAASAVQIHINPIAAGHLEHQIAKGRIKMQSAIPIHRLATGEIQHQAAKGHVHIATPELLGLHLDAVGAERKVSPWRGMPSTVTLCRRSFRHQRQLARSKIIDTPQRISSRPNTSGQVMSAGMTFRFTSRKYRPAAPAPRPNAESRDVQEDSPMHSSAEGQATDQNPTSSFKYTATT